MKGRKDFYERTFNERFWRRVEPQNGGKCRNWLGTCGSHGYGMVSRNGKNVRTHRVAYELVFGEFNVAFDVLHKCDNPLCCNPEHLYLGTDVENQRDAAQRGGHKAKMGEQHPMARLNSSDIINIRNSFHKKGVFQHVLAKQYGVTKTQISRIVHNRVWKSVGGQTSPPLKRLDQKVRIQIRLLRQQGITQSKMAKMFGVTQSAISRIVRHV